MGLLSRLTEQREQLILDHARPFLDDDESVLQWARARRAVGRGNGFVFLTPKRIVFAWTRGDDDQAIPWKDIQSWGLDRDEKGGPVLGITTPDGFGMAQLVTGTDGLADNAREMILRLVELAPVTEEPFEVEGEPGRFHPVKDVSFVKEPRSWWQMTRRFAVTVGGVAMIVIGILLIPVPGPWSFLINIAGLAVLASEYDWAQDLLIWTRRKFEQAKAKIAKRRRRKEGV